ELSNEASKEEEEKLLRKALARPQDGTSTFVTGGDVSRFQRSTLPRERVAETAGGEAVAAPVAPTGPTVRVSRGNNTSVENVDRGAGKLLDRQAQSVSSA